MASARPERVYHQDYIARIRYSNVLPPPPNPPKLLDIPNTGLSSGTYTSAIFASRLAREQSLNIEADAELGMPIDLVGLPKVFEGDERVIQALDNPPSLHPTDKLLMRPAGTLGKPSSVTSGVSFLRRTEYMTSLGGQGMRYESTTSKELLRSRTPVRKKRRAETLQDDPTHILKSIIKGFDIAYPREAYKGPDSDAHIRGAEILQQERDAWNNPRHPSKPNLKLVDSYPLIPDLESIPATGSYFVVKYQTNPVAPTDVYDERLDVAILRPLDISEAGSEKLVQAQANHGTEDDIRAIKTTFLDYEFFLPHPERVQDIKRKFSSVNEIDNNSIQDFDSSENTTFEYLRQRVYETTAATGSTTEPFSTTVALALYDPVANDEQEGGRRRQKAAYYYPIAQRLFMKPRRQNKAPQTMGHTEEERVDIMSVSITDMEPEAAEASLRGEWLGKIDPQTES
ncbi:Paf1-domain-containing protein [Patellaria atrata CBS 101060]|uniref:Paf1-domain-containing protein n=1 Tax=Patellaria atrata CBS 101060 TaxID=1346257 RepID=A0A9P4VX23_9PEZI|nr:Paf1-domain-containing protein [Patellaria atrata CBS 101060]